jgi:hypothetical protein
LNDVDAIAADVRASVLATPFVAEANGDAWSA